MSPGSSVSYSPSCLLFFFHFAPQNGLFHPRISLEFVINRTSYRNARELGCGNELYEARCSLLSPRQLARQEVGHVNGQNEGRRRSSTQNRAQTRYCWMESREDEQHTSPALISMRMGVRSERPMLAVVEDALFVHRAEREWVCDTPQQSLFALPTRNFALTVCTK